MRNPGAIDDHKVSVLFSEPKIPQYQGHCASHRTSAVSVLFSEPKIPQSLPVVLARLADTVSVLFSEPKIPQLDWLEDFFSKIVVSVLFSEPKIPQSPARAAARLTARRSFSALQRAENSSISRTTPSITRSAASFSALQRAENSSIRNHQKPGPHQKPFQCSSASRKFLNRDARPGRVSDSVVSVLFSEPKIPQCCAILALLTVLTVFQCSSASRKFLNSAG